MSGDGWILRFSGPEAKKGGLIDDVLDEVERWFQPVGEGVTASGTQLTGSSQNMELATASGFHSLKYHHRIR